MGGDLAQQRRSAAEPEGEGGWPLILVVDDDEDSCGATRTILEDEGYRVEVARNGRAALERLRSQPYPTLILLDLMMPVMDGPSLLAELQGRAELERIPVVLMTASGPDSRTSGLPYPLLRKPFGLDDLLGMITVRSPRLWDEEEPTDEDSIIAERPPLLVRKEPLDDATPRVYCLGCGARASARCVGCGEAYCRRCIDAGPARICGRCWRKTHP